MTLVPFDDRDGAIWMDGEFMDWRDAKVHVLSHGLHYGSAVFEGGRVYDGRMFKNKEHTERLFRSGAILDFDMPFSVAEVEQACVDAVNRMGLESAYIRPVAWRGPEQMSVSAMNTKVHVAVAVWDWPSYFDPEAAKRGIRLTYAPWKRPAPDTAPVHAKAAGLYLIGTLSKHHAEKNGYADALMLDYRGYVAEATGANIFFTRDGAIHTPTPDCFLNGITRQTVIGLAKDRGFEVVERHIKPEELSTFNECFITGTAAEVTFVSEIGEHRFTPGNMSFTLQDDYNNLVRGKLTVAA